MLTANQKYIDTANIKHLLSAGEKNADKIQIAVDRYYHQMDLSVCLFTLRAINSSGGLIMQNLEKEITENQIILTWVVTEDFTATSGQLLPEIVGQQDNTVVIKYEMTPMVVRNSILEQYHGGIDAIDKALREMQSILAQTEQLTAKMPIIKNGTWWLYDIATGDYIDSGYPAQGDKGDTGKTGEKGDTGTPGKDGVNGTDGKDGADGFSPTATVTETDTGATITITDKNGTTTATVKNGTSGEAASWGDFTPGWDGQATLSYCKAKLVTVMGKQTWQILPSISTVSHNALDIVPDGLFVPNLSPDVNALKESFDDTRNAKTVYVNAANGFDTQDGSTQANALQTLDKALQCVQYAGKAVIYLAAGTYAVPDKTLTLLGRDVRIYGDAAATTTIQGNLVCENGFLLLRRLTIDSTDSTTANATADTITLQYNAALRMGDCIINTAGKNAVSATEMSTATIVSTTFQGATQYAVYTTGLSDAKIYTCTDATAKGVRSGGGSVVSINNATGENFSYTNGSNGMVFVDGRQVLPNPGSIQFRHGNGTFTAAATGTNVTWQYGGQQVQNNKCTFDVKSDNGLICVNFDNITSLTISNDTALKMCLSDLGGKITDGLTLSGCSGITGDLSDLGGNIKGGIALNSCPNITGDLSDLGGKISRSLLFTGCTAITGVYTGTVYPKTFTVSKTSITSADMDANLINFAASGVKSGKFTAANMTRTAASDDAVATLVTNGWTVSGLTKE